MTIYEYIEQNKHILSCLSRNGIGTSWGRYCEIYNDYMRMIREGYKKTYIVAWLSNNYNLNNRQIFNILSELEKEII